VRDLGPLVSGAGPDRNSQAVGQAVRSSRLGEGSRAAIWQLAVVRDHYNTIRLHAGIGYVTPDDEHEGRGEAIRKAREAGLEQARLRRLARHRHHRDNSTQQEPGDVV
jgi:hypothetical protein